MSTLNYIKTLFEMSAKEFMAEWKLLSKADQEEMRTLAREDAEREGVTLSN